MYGNMGLAKSFAAIVGVVLVLGGLLGFLNTSLAADPTVTANPLFVTGVVHNLVHLITGALALYIAFGLRGDQQATGLIGFGILYGLIFILILVSPNLFGILGDHRYDVNIVDHVLHVALAVLSIAVGYLARGERGTAVATR